MASVPLVLIAVSCLMILLSVSADSLQDILFNGDYDFIDLTHPFDNSTVYWPGSQNFQFTKKIEQPESADSTWYAANEFAGAEHGGTHIDAPYHFYQSGNFVGDLPLKKLILPLVIVDVSSKVNGDPEYVLYKKDLDSSLKDKLEKPCVVIFKFGWSQYFSNPEKYLGYNKTGLTFPGLTAEVAEYITTFKNVAGIGVDTASVDAGANTDLTVHKILAKAGLYNMENVNLYKPISETQCTALVLPMKIGMGTGAPLRLVAVCPKEV